MARAAIFRLLREQAGIMRVLKKAVCANAKCEKSFVPAVKSHIYCSRKCSAAVRNHRYYLTWEGRLKKRAAASRYFQQHRLEIYERRRSRMARYVEEILASREATAEDGHLLSMRQDIDDSTARLVHAKHLVRVRHDWHPRQLGDQPLGRIVYFPGPNGTPVLCSTRAMCTDCAGVRRP